MQNCRSPHIVLRGNNNFTRSEEEWYYFLHIPNTAGTTFRFILYDYFDQAEIYPNYYELTAKQRSRYYGWKEFHPQNDQLFHQGKRLLIGHFGWAVMRHYSTHKPLTLTFLRDPVKRIKSAIVYLRKRDRMYAGMSIEEVIDKYLSKEGTLQARQLGYQPKRGIDVAIRNLESVNLLGYLSNLIRALPCVITLLDGTYDLYLKRMSVHTRKNHSHQSRSIK